MRIYNVHDVSYEALTLILVERPNGLDPVTAGERDDQIVRDTVTRIIINS